MDKQDEDDLSQNIKVPDPFLDKGASRSLFCKSYSMPVPSQSDLNPKITEKSVSLDMGRDLSALPQSNCVLKHDHISLETLLGKEEPSTLNLKNLFTNQTISLDEKLIRTYFHQILDGLGYLHSMGFSHLSLDTENILLDKDFMIRISKLERMVKINAEIEVLASKGFRAPEVRKTKSKDTKSADIYSAAIVLFALKCQGQPAHYEAALKNGVNLENVMNEDNFVFWKWHTKNQFRTDDFFSEDFKFLFLGMTKADPKQRMKMQEIKQSRWCNGPIYNKDEVKGLMKKLIARN